MRKLGYEELQNKLENIYDQIEEVQRKIEEDNKQRNEILNGISIGIEVINYFNQMNETIKLIKENDEKNQNEINLIVNKIVDEMVNNEKRLYENKVNKINELRKEVKNEKDQNYN